MEETKLLFSITKCCGENAQCLDENNILWKQINSKFIGKKAVFCKDNSAKWIDDILNNEQKCFYDDVDYNKVYTK